MDQALVPVKLPESLREAWREHLRACAEQDPSALPFVNELAEAMGRPASKGFRSQVSRFVQGNGDALCSYLADPKWRAALEKVVADPAALERWLMERLMPASERRISVDDLVGLDVSVRRNGSVLRWSEVLREARVPAAATIEKPPEVAEGNPAVPHATPSQPKGAPPAPTPPVVVRDPAGWRRSLGDDGAANGLQWSEPTTHMPGARRNCTTRPSDNDAKATEIEIIGPDPASVSDRLRELTRRATVTEDEAHRMERSLGLRLEPARAMLVDVVRTPEDLVDLLEDARRGRVVSAEPRVIRRALGDAMVSRWVQLTDCEGLRGWFANAGAFLNRWIDTAGALDAPVTAEQWGAMQDRPTRVGPDRLRAAITALLNGDEAARRREAKDLALAAGADVFRALIEAGLVSSDGTTIELGHELRRWADLCLPLEVTPSDEPTLCRHPDGLRWIGDAVRLAEVVAPWVDAALAEEVAQPELALTVLDAVAARAETRRDAPAGVTRLWASTVWMVLHGLHEETVSWQDWNLGHDRRLVAASEALAKVLPRLDGEPYAELRSLVLDRVADRVTAWRRDPPVSRLAPTPAASHEGEDEPEASAPWSSHREAYRDVGEALCGLCDLAPYQIPGEILFAHGRKPDSEDQTERLLRFHAGRGSLTARRTLARIGRTYFESGWYSQRSATRSERWSWTVEDPEAQKYEIERILVEVLCAADDGSLAKADTMLLGRLGTRLTSTTDAELAWYALRLSDLDRAETFHEIASMVGAGSGASDIQDQLVKWLHSATPERCVEAMVQLGRASVLQVWAAPTTKVVQAAMAHADWTPTSLDVRFPMLERLGELRHYALLALARLGEASHWRNDARTVWTVEAPAIADAQSLGQVFSFMSFHTDWKQAARLPLVLTHDERMAVGACALGVQDWRALTSNGSTHEYVHSMHVLERASSTALPTPELRNLAVAALSSTEAPMLTCLAPLLLSMWGRRNDSRLKPLLESLRAPARAWTEKNPRFWKQVLTHWQEPTARMVERERAWVRGLDTEVIDDWIATLSVPWEARQPHEERREHWLRTLAVEDSSVASVVLPKVPKETACDWANSLPDGEAHACWWTYGYGALVEWRRPVFARKHGSASQIRAAEREYVENAPNSRVALDRLSQATVWAPSDGGRAIVVDALDHALAQSPGHDYAEVLVQVHRLSRRLFSTAQHEWLSDDLVPRISTLYSRAVVQASAWTGGMDQFAYAEDFVGVGTWLVARGPWDADHVDGVLTTCPVLRAQWRRKHHVSPLPVQQRVDDLLDYYDRLGPDVAPEHGGTAFGGRLDRVLAARTTGDALAADGLMNAVMARDDKHVSLLQGTALLVLAGHVPPALGAEIGTWAVSRIKLNDDDQKRRWAGFLRDTAAWSGNPGLAGALRRTLDRWLKVAAVARRNAGA